MKVKKVDWSMQCLTMAGSVLFGDEGMDEGCCSEALGKSVRRFSQQSTAATDSIV